MNDIMTRFSLSGILLASGPLLILFFGKHDLAVAEGIICMWVGFGSVCMAGKDAALMLYSGAATSRSAPNALRPISAAELDAELADLLEERRRTDLHLAELDRSIEARRWTRMCMEIEEAPDPYRHPPLS